MSRALIFSAIWLLSFVSATELGASSNACMGWPHVVKDFPPVDRETLGVSFSVHYFLISITQSKDQSAGGSGGRIADITVKDLSNGKSLAFSTQEIGGRVLTNFNGYPQFEVWTRGGGGTWARSLFRLEHGKYQWIRADQFDLNIARAKEKSITSTLPGRDKPIYYTGTIYPQN